MTPLIPLVVAAQQGDLEAFGQIVQRFQDMAFAGAYAWLEDAPLAQDIAQEAFVDAYLNLSQLREPAAFPGWFRRIVRKHCDRFTRRKRPVIAPFETITSLQATAEDPASIVETDQMKALVQQAIADLPEHQRLVTTLFYISGYAQQEIAAFLELPLTTIKKRLFDARRRLKERMAQTVSDYLHTQRPSRNDSFSDTIQFFLAIQAGNAARVTYLLKKTPALIETTCEYHDDLAQELGYWPTGALPLDWAARLGDEEMAALLLANGADPNSGLPGAVMLGRPDLVALLLSRGADVNLPGRNGQTPLHLAVIQGAAEVAAVLCRHGAEVDRPDGQGYTPLDWARFHSDQAIAELLLAASTLASHPTPGAQGIVARVDGAQVYVDFETDQRPSLHQLLIAPQSPKLLLEAEAYLSERMVRCVLLASSPELQPGLTVIDRGERLTVPVGTAIRGRILNTLGQPLDGGPDLTAAPRRPVGRPALHNEQASISAPILETGIKMIDLLAPLRRGGISGVFVSDYGLGKMVLLGEILHRLTKRLGGDAVWVRPAVGPAEISGGEVALRELNAHPRTVIVCGQPDDPAPLRSRLLAAGQTMAAHFQEFGSRETLLLVETGGILAESAANLESLTGIGRSGETSVIIVGSMDDRRALERQGEVSCDSVLTFSQRRAKQQLYPALDGVGMTANALSVAVVGERHVRVAGQVASLLAHYQALQQQIDTVGLEALRDEDRRLVGRARRLDRFLTQPFYVAEAWTGRPGAFVPLNETLAGCQAILAGRVDDVPEEAFYFVGTLAEALEQAKTL